MEDDLYELPASPLTAHAESLLQWFGRLPAPQRPRRSPPVAAPPSDRAAILRARRVAAASSPADCSACDGRGWVGRWETCEACGGFNRLLSGRT